VSITDRIHPVLYDLLGAPVEKKPLIRGMRRKLLEGARGRVLEVGAGTGFNVPYYPDEIEELTLTDGLGGMLRRAERRAEQAGRTVTTTRASVDDLPYEDGSFDTVVGSLLLCSVPDQDRALAEIRRVLRPGGHYLFLEHVRSADPAAARRQDRWEGVWRRLAMGCRPNRDTLPRIESAFTVDRLEQGEIPMGPKIVRPYALGRAATPV
jgi:ubiquinone/menaquinone biosynthesis C-methylase UbiE